MTADPPPDTRSEAGGDSPEEVERAAGPRWDWLAETKPTDLDPSSQGEAAVPAADGTARRGGNFDGSRPPGSSEAMAYAAGDAEGRERPSNDAAGRLVHGRYRLVAILHAGGMGITYRAWDTQARIPVVVKMPKPQARSDREATARFRREIEAMRAVPHESIVPITDSGDDDGCPFVVMRFLPGGSLADYRRRDESGRVIKNPPGMLHLWLPGVARALDHIHSRGLVHRDVKPGNIFLDGFLRPFLGDFGIAKVMDEAGGLAKEETLTAPKEAMGTPEYMAPELFRPKPQADGRIDQYALAITVYEMLAGKRPFSGSTHHIILEHTSLAVPPLVTSCPGLPQSLCAAVERALSKKKEARFATCGEFAAAALAGLPVLEPEADTVRLLCPNCRNILKLSLQTAGKRGRCPRCQAVIDVAADLGSLWLDREERGEAFPAVPQPTPEVLPEKVGPQLSKTGPRSGRWVAGLAIASVLFGFAAGTLWGSARRESPARHAPEPEPALAPGPAMEPGQSAELLEPVAPVEPAPDDTIEKLAAANLEIEALEEALAEYADMQSATAAQALRLDAALADNERLRQLVLAARESEKVNEPGGRPAAESFTNSIAMQFVPIPAGAFTMGNKAAEREGDWDERPARRVTILKAFFIGMHEVTNAQWKTVMGDVPSTWQDDDRPVETVSWEDARLFCTRLSEVPAEREAGRAYRLPTEAEWEYACRAGTVTRFSFGNEEGSLGEYAWYFGNAGDQTHPVGRRKPNPWGLYDVHGNVAEWCGDRYGPYTPDPLTNPTGPAEGDERVVRGGSWLSIPGLCRSSRRDIGALRSDTVGLRVVAELP